MTYFTFYNLIDDVTPRLHLVKYHVIISEYKNQIVINLVGRTFPIFYLNTQVIYICDLYLT